MTLAILVLALVTIQRLAELVIARRNTERLLKAGAIEASPGHYPLIVALHATWLIGLWVLAYNIPPNLVLIGIFLILQALRVWVLVTLGPRWTTRIIILPGAPLVTTGPFRFLSHPNYCVVVAELLILPLAFGLVWYGIIFSILNAMILTIRIRAENEALQS
ncbi:MAG: isoprenylcysteine carboxyl methyltransferase family protein [Geminicoccales bacterium]